MKQSCLIAVKQNKTKNHSNKSSCALLSSGKIQLRRELSWPEYYPRPRESQREWRGEEKLCWRSELHSLAAPRLTADSTTQLSSRQSLMRAASWGSKPANPGIRLSCVCWDGWVTAAYTSLSCTPFPMFSEVACALGKSPRRFHAAECTRD